ncbi:MAG TPA: transporter substrate-binding domain-containing protein [Treponemataceae bacterium]|nr:transporter substrate-binding domain-containing protein [Treponemataceae bacterium]
MQMRFGIALLLCLACICVTHAEKLKIGVFIHSPYVMQKAPGSEPYGPGVDYAKAVARALGYEPDVRLLPIARIIDNLENGSLDMGLELGMTEARKKFLLYPASPCLVSHPALTVKADNAITAIASAKDLTGMRIGYILGGYTGSFFNGKKNVTFEYVSGDAWIAQNFSKLMSGRIDAILDQNEYSCLAEARQRGVEKQIKVLLLPGAPVKSYVVFSRASPDAKRLLRAYNALDASSVPSENALVLKHLDSIGR